jgi:hypothetical protein
VSTTQERIADAFNGYFANFGIRIETGDVRIGVLREIRGSGWLIRYRVVADDAGAPGLEFYATHRMTDDTHVRIWADGHTEELEAIREAYAFDASVPGSKEAAEEEYLRANRRIADHLTEIGLYPKGDINAFLRTGGADDVAGRPEGPHD